MKEGEFKDSRLSRERARKLFERFRKELNVDYLDMVQIHCMVDENWTETMKPQMDILENLDKYINQETNYKVEKLDCSGSFALDSLKKNPAYSSISDLYRILNPLAIGMALRGIK